MLPPLLGKNRFAKRDKPFLWNQNRKRGRHVIDDLINNSKALLSAGGKVLISHSSRLNEEMTKSLLDKEFKDWNLLVQKDLALEKRFIPLLDLWKNIPNAINTKRGQTFEKFSIIEMTNE